MREREREERGENEEEYKRAVLFVFIFHICIHLYTATFRKFLSFKITRREGTSYLEIKRHLLPRSRFSGRVTRVENALMKNNEWEEVVALKI